jgi:hypothetical protein
MTKHKLKQFTTQTHHGGAYYDLDLIFRDTCDLVLPCTREVRITMALQFEIFRLRDEGNDEDEVLLQNCDV